MNENAHNAFEKRLAALQPARHGGEEATVLYRCGFAAGQASALANHASPANRGAGWYRGWLPAIAAACLTAILVGPASYRIGSSRIERTGSATTVAETVPLPAVPSQRPTTLPPADSAPFNTESPAPVRDTAPLQDSMPRQGLPAERPTNILSDPYRNVIASWLLGPGEVSPWTLDQNSRNGIVLTSRPPSAQAIASIENSPLPRMRWAPSNSRIPNDTSAESLHIRSQPSQLSPTDWEHWIQ